MAKRVHVIDSDVRRRARVSRELHAQGLHVEIYEHIEEFLEHSPEEGLVFAAHGPDCRGGHVGGIIETANIDLQLVAYAEDPSPGQIVEAMLAGACGYLVWPFDIPQLHLTLDRLSVEGARRLLRERMLTQARNKVETLSLRERQVLIGLIGGLSTKENGQRLGISPRTVEIYRSNMMIKLAAHQLRMPCELGFTLGSTIIGMRQVYGMSPEPRAFALLSSACILARHRRHRRVLLKSR